MLRSGFHAVCAGLAALLAGCLDPAAAELDQDLVATVPEVIDVVGAAEASATTPRPVYMVHDAADIEVLESEMALQGFSAAPDVLHHATTVVYMNRAGGTYSPGLNDARANRSTIINQTTTIPEWNVSDSGWDQVMACVNSLFSPFDIQITDVDPGNVPHVESIVAGTPQQVGLAPNVGGVSPFTSDCAVIPNSIVYTFAEVYGTNYRLVCEVAAQEIAHSFGLDHQFLCEDPMTYLGGCGDKTFQNTDAPCGEDSVRTCYCGQQTQNSVVMLNQRVGVGTGPTAGPSVAVTFPPEGAAVVPGFGVYVNATDGGGVRNVELSIDGAVIASDNSAPFQFGTPKDLALGAHTITIVAVNNAGLETTTTLNVVVDADADPTEPSAPVDPTALEGGCSTSGGGASSGLLLLLGAAISLLNRRRRPADLG